MAGLALVLFTIAAAILASVVIVALTSWRDDDAGKLAVSVLVTAVALLDGMRMWFEMREVVLERSFEQWVKGD